MGQNTTNQAAINNPVKEQLRLEVLSRHDYSLFTCLREGDDVVAVGAAGVAFGFACGHSVRTSPQHRRRDLAGRIIGALAHAVSPHEAESLPVMLQVEVDNTGAIELYHRIGFASSPLRWLSSAGRVINHLRKDAAPDAIE